jgi:hypothetical protein
VASAAWSRVAGDRSSPWFLRGSEGFEEPRPERFVSRRAEVQESIGRCFGVRFEVPEETRREVGSEVGEAGGMGRFGRSDPRVTGKSACSAERELIAFGGNQATAFRRGSRGNRA